MDDVRLKLVLVQLEEIKLILRQIYLVQSSQQELKDNGSEIEGFCDCRSLDCKLRHR